MAISAVTIHVNSGAAATSFTSSSFTPTANAIHIAFMNARTGSAAIPTITDSVGNTWTLVSGTNLSVGAGNLKCSLYYWVAGASPAAMTATVTSSGAIACSLMLVAYTGAATDTANINVNQNTAGDPAPTNAAMAATSTGLAFNSQNAGAAPTATPSAQGYTSIINSAPATNLRHTLFTDSASPANSVSWTSTGTDSVGILWELKEASTGFTGTAAQTLIPVAQAATGSVIVKTTAFQVNAFQASPAFQIVAPAAVTGTIAQTLGPAAQAASGTVTAAPAITGTAAQTLSAAQQSTTGTVTAPAAVTGTAAQTLAPVLQSASGSVAVAGAIVGQIDQTLTRTAQAASGTVTAAPAVTGTIAQTLQRAQQDATGLVALAGTFVGTIAQTAPSVFQNATGTVTSAEIPARVGGFADWSEELGRKLRKRQKQRNREREELRTTLERLFSGKTPEIDLVDDEMTDVLAVVPDTFDAQGLRAELQVIEVALRQALAAQEQERQIEAERFSAMMAAIQEEEAIVSLLA